MVKVASIFLIGLLVLSALTFLIIPASANSGLIDVAEEKVPWLDDGAEMDVPPGQSMKEKVHLKDVKLSLKGKINYSNGHSQGSYIFFDLEEETGNITNYGMVTSEGEKVLFSSIVFEELIPQRIETRGSLIRIVDDNNTAVIHDNPTGMFHLFVNQSVRVTITLAEDMVVIDQKETNESDNKTYQLTISDGTSLGFIASNDSFDVSENDTVIGCEVSEYLIIRFLPQVAQQHQWIELFLSQAVQDGLVAAEVTLIVDDEGGVYDIVSYRNELHIQVQEVVKNRFQMSVQGESGNGALLLVHADNGTMDMSRDRLRVRLNDREMMETSDLLEIFYGQPEQACFAIIDYGGEQQMLVYLPSSTLGTVVVESVDPLSDLLSPFGLAMIVGAVGLVAVAGVVALRKR